MSWQTITATEVQTRLSGPELSALRTAALATGQTDPLTDIIAQAIDLVRGHVAACKRNTLGVAGTVPATLIATTIDIIRYRLATRLPAAAILTQVRQQEYKDALALLSQVAACKFVLEEPTTPSTELLSSGPAPATTDRPRNFTPSLQDGI